MGTHVAFNLAFLVPGETGGMEVAAREVLTALVREAPADIRFTALINREAAAAGEGPWLELMPAQVLPVNATSRPARVLAEQTSVPHVAQRIGADLVHSLGNTAPGWGRFKRVTSINDLIVLAHPEAHTKAMGLGMRVLFPAAVRSSHRIIAISQATKDDLVTRLHADPDRVDVVPLGGATAPGPPLAEPELRARLDLGDRPLLLSVSAKRPHKNLLRLIEAHATLDAPRPLLVLPGYATWHEDELRERAAALGIADDVRFLGWLAPEELEGLYAAATAFVFPSLYEGFGMPVLEAMARGVPVATSNRSSLPEVAGDAALLFDPEDPAAIAGALRRLLGDEPLRADLVRRGHARAAEFTWSRTAQLTLQSYARALRG